MIFDKLRESAANCFNVTHEIKFKPLMDLSDKADLVFEFAYGMTFGKEGKHRDHRTGGFIKRKNGELFINTFQGKLAEFGMCNLFSASGLNVNVPDTAMWSTGIWDDVDLIVNEKKINIKSAAFFSNLLLLETKDWDSQGNYLPNIEKGTGAYDYFVLSRLKPDGKALMRKEKLFYADYAAKDLLKKIMLSAVWEFDIAGFISNDDLKQIIKEKQILPQKAMLNGKIKMDAENYYCQAGNMRPIETLFHLK